MDLKKRETWTTREGDVVSIAEMGSEHLFFTVRMLWNHSAPRELRMEPYKRWRFTKQPSYYAKKVRPLLRELFTRLDDLKPWMREAVEFMRDNAPVIDDAAHYRMDTDLVRKFGDQGHAVVFSGGKEIMRRGFGVNDHG